MQLPEFLDDAVAVTNWYLDHVPADMVTYWDFDDPPSPTPSVTPPTPIAAAAMVKLSALGDRYRDAAQRTVEALADRHVNHRGALVDGCYHRVKDVAVSQNSVCKTIRNPRT